MTLLSCYWRYLLDHLSQWVEYIITNQRSRTVVNPFKKVCDISNVIYNTPAADVGF